MPKRILIVDHQRHSRTLLEGALEPLLDQGVELAAVQSGSEALTATSERPPDLAFIDASMPGSAGYELCKKLRGSAATESTYIFMLLDKGLEADAARCLDAGANDFILTPFDPDNLLERVCAALGVEGDFL